MYLLRRGPAYYYRRPILKGHIGLWLGPTGKPRREWSVSLRTKDRRTAIDRMAKAEGRYNAELARNIAEASKRAEMGLAFASSPAIPPAHDDPDYLAMSARSDLEEAGRAEWEIENDPLWAEREALREQVATLRDAKSNRELGAELRTKERAARAVAFMSLFDDYAAICTKCSDDA